MPEKTYIKNMFDSIAADYDKLNHILSLNIDKIWRKKAISRIALKNCKILDLACGTGDFSIALAKYLIKNGCRESIILGMDISAGMINVMKKKVEEENLSEFVFPVQGDGENMDFEDETFDYVTIAFGIRNFEDREKGLREIFRILKKEGNLIIIELSRPENCILKFLYNLYFKNIIPFFGGLVSGNRQAYDYLPDSVCRFPGKDEFMDELKNCGYDGVSHTALTLGTCRLYVARKSV